MVARGPCNSSAIIAFVGVVCEVVFGVIEWEDSISCSEDEGPIGYIIIPHPIHCIYIGDTPSYPLHRRLYHTSSYPLHIGI